MTLKGHSGSIQGAALSDDEQFALTGAEDNTIRIWRISDGAEVSNIPRQARVLLLFSATSFIDTLCDRLVECPFTRHPVRLRSP